MPHRLQIERVLEASHRGMSRFEDQLCGSNLNPGQKGARL